MDVDAFHRRCCIADAHADSLMWNRDLTQAQSAGHVDFPRLKEAGVKLQCFTVVTRGYPFIDGFGAFAWAKGWSRAQRQGEWARCRAQLEWMRELCARAPEAVSVAEAGGALEANRGAARVSAVLGVEGAHALEGQVERVAELHRLGVRFMGLLHLHNNELGGSSFPLMGNRGLTPLGHEVLDAMAAVGMAVDLAHASPRTVEDILAHGGPPVFCSHGGVQGAHRSWRNLSDATLRTVAERGGVMGIILTPIYLGGRTLEAVVRHVEHALSVMGEDGVGLGSDFDGLVPLPVGMHDCRDLKRVTEALDRAGIPERVIEKVMGANLWRFCDSLLTKAVRKGG